MIVGDGGESFAYTTFSVGKCGQDGLRRDSNSRRSGYGGNSGGGLDFLFNPFRCVLCRGGGGDSPILRHRGRLRLRLRSRSGCRREPTRGILHRHKSRLGCSFWFRFGFWFRRRREPTRGILRRHRLCPGFSRWNKPTRHTFLNRRHRFRF